LESVGGARHFPEVKCVDLTSEVDLRGQDWNSSDSDAADDDDSLDDDKNYSSDDSGNDFMPSGRRAEEITAEEIQDAILRALAKCPNQSCTLHSLTARVLKEVGVLTRGRPREEFERRTMRSVSVLERLGRIETYKAKKVLLNRSWVRRLCLGLGLRLERLRRGSASPTASPRSYGVAQSFLEGGWPSVGPDVAIRPLVTPPARRSTQDGVNGEQIRRKDTAVDPTGTHERLRRGAKNRRLRLVRQ
jgi:hypothetical protein